jgi:hypothetical protein
MHGIQHTCKSLDLQRSGVSSDVVMTIAISASDITAVLHHKWGLNTENISYIYLLTEMDGVI